jgi:hypothetical protein
MMSQWAFYHATCSLSGLERRDAGLNRSAWEQAGHGANDRVAVKYTEPELIGAGSHVLSDNGMSAVADRR